MGFEIVGFGFDMLVYSDWVFTLMGWLIWFALIKLFVSFCWFGALAWVWWVGLLWFVIGFLGLGS